MQPLHNTINAASAIQLPTLHTVLSKSGVDERLERFIETQRDEIKDILSRKDQRMLVIIGPCSIHDPNAALEYANRLAKVQKQFSQTLKIVMRTYFEKPRTRKGWKGFIVDPELTGDFNLEQGIYQSRSLLKSILELGVPTATEFLDTNIAPYIADLVCWGAIGARTTESQPHRQLASALHCAIGFKNGTDGNTSISIDAIHAAGDSHLLVTFGSNGHPIVLQTPGNPHCHVILRGGLAPNYFSPNVRSTAYDLEYNKLAPSLIIDCSHGNSGKIAKNQLNVINNICDQLTAGETSISGVMCESFLQGGNQALNSEELCYGKSITDECLNWDDSVSFLSKLDEAVKIAYQNEYLHSEIA
ncbi:3-deoxy-7-phosphoheptulonate synthase [Vibrio sp. Vb2853]|uniref:3-deoxy-7-phosphoheptulonate synthase n=1 Tax=unclassified Vibrio TaxID=2614977 RepID=UPI0021D2D869|nr:MULTISPECIES: 3-deoxy-7-phosphoheptulonate synthase [unclassified Vibrio]MDW1616644.1 3-deoxy-7-phosphoheptulonate synthase [Vibrio sp. Vb2881]MDW1621343.1 3-deoxy-7-phosphoheptulonate synthase [Vibrio sp. Vb2864]MDW1693494.1 3-deoxy-7-phosphoheptulonate synthase [Vibrio sp. Vb2853]MDW1712189.1 3-deoxy-7-phosphoheptulonate synthase [Vibrio sp. Vb2865]MDW1717309.1 3-deoxy-7-phosphoheptulonate synthase [Vibrio sp. Vb2873]